nr:hypothetical protein [Tanacetum cinerariifolium]
MLRGKLNAEIADTIVEYIPSLPILVHDSNSQQEEINVVTSTDDVLPLSVENDDDSSSDPLLEEDNPSIPRPPPEPPDAEANAGEEIPVMMNEKDKDYIPSLPILVHDSNSQQEEINVVTSTDDVLPLSVENDDDSSSDPLLEEVDLFLFDNSIPSGIENIANDPEGDIRFLEELLIDDSILSHESSDSNFKDNPSIPRPPPEPPNAEANAGEEIPVMMNEKDKDVDYSSFIFVIFYKMFSFLSAESEDTIFNPDISD